MPYTEPGMISTALEKPTANSITIPQHKHNITVNIFIQQAATFTCTISSTMFKNLFSPEGIIGRREYALSWGLFFVTVYLIDAIVQSSVKETGFVLFLVFPPIYILAQGAKRCHDMGHSGWRQFIPFYIIWMLVVRSAGSRKKTTVNITPLTGAGNAKQPLESLTA